MEDDILGRAISDFYYNRKPAKLWVLDDYGPRTEMRVATYFRNEDSMPLLERKALQLCRGHVLDIGAGAGSHALWLQAHGHRVTALDIAPGSVAVMRDRGLEHVVCADISTYKGGPFDTLLLLMNGIGLTGNIAGLHRFLQHAHTLLAPGGQLLFDSSDVSYLFDEGIPQGGDYYGEIRCRYSYKRAETGPFTWLYIDRDTLRSVAGEEGWYTEVIMEDETGQYLVRLTRSHLANHSEIQA